MKCIKVKYTENFHIKENLINNSNLQEIKSFIH